MTSDAEKRARAAEVLYRYEEDRLLNFDGRALTDVNQRGLLGDYPIHVAAVRGAFDDMVALIDAGADINARGEDGNTALHLAAGFGHLDLVRLLLTHRAETSIRNDFGDTPFEWASRRERYEIAELIAQRSVPES
jgi:uncharacterized protein